MSTSVEAIQAQQNWCSTRLPGTTTSFSALDYVTGGFNPGHVWIIPGTPGQGRSMLATQWALHLGARQHLRTEMISVREPEHLVTTRLLACAGRVPVMDLWAGELTEDSEQRLREARDVIAEAPLRIAGPQQLSVLCHTRKDTDLPEALVLDDFELAASVAPSDLTQLAMRGLIVIATPPRHWLLKVGVMDPAWTRIADFILDIERPDLLDHTSPRAGEADIHLVRNRWGPQVSTTAAFEGHYARFVEMRS